MVKHDAVTGSDLEGLNLARIMFLVSWVCAFVQKALFEISCISSKVFLSCSSIWDIVVCASIASTKRDCYVSLLLYNCYFIERSILSHKNVTLCYL